MSNARNTMLSYPRKRVVKVLPLLNNPRLKLQSFSETDTTNTEHNNFQHNTSDIEFTTASISSEPIQQITAITNPTQPNPPTNNISLTKYSTSSLSKEYYDRSSDEELQAVIEEVRFMHYSSESDIDVFSELVSESESQFSDYRWDEDLEFEIEGLRKGMLPSAEDIFQELMKTVPVEVDGNDRIKIEEVVRELAKEKAELARWEKVLQKKREEFINRVLDKSCKEAVSRFLRCIGVYQ